MIHVRCTGEGIVLSLTVNNMSLKDKFVTTIFILLSDIPSGFGEIENVSGGGVLELAQFSIVMMITWL